MKNIIYLFINLLATIGFSQNLVPNGGFEENPQNYNGGTNPTSYYSPTNEFCNTGQHRFEDEITGWKVANPSPLFLSACSPDWMPGSVDDTDGSCGFSSSFYVRCASKQESIVIELKDGYKLIKGKSYKFSIKARAARGYSAGTGSFQVVFSTEDEGLQVQPHKKWVALDFYLTQSCDWRYLEGYFTVPNDNENNYEDMKYLVLQYNHEVNNGVDPDDRGVSLVLHYDDVYLIEEEPCLDHKKIQDWQYYDEHRIVQANVKISAGAHVYQMEDPTSNYPQSPVIVKSSAMVIYRAPNIYLEPGFFIEEPGSYFETQVGTCVADPCPTLPSYTPPPLAFCSQTTLGEEIVEEANAPGIFYAWTPSEYFTAPWSRVTDFVPPPGNGCVDAKLTIWSICGASQEYSFPIRYYDAAPTVSITNVQISPTKIIFKANFENVQDYTVIVTNTTTGEVLYESTETMECGTNIVAKTVILGACNFEMCGDKAIKVIADNACFDQAEASFIAMSPVVVSPSLNISNVEHDDFSFAFDVGVNENTEFVTIELWNEDMSTLECTKTYRSCDIGGLSVIHWDNLLCQSGCISVCGNHRLKVRYKNVCMSQVLEETLYWNKTSSDIDVPYWPNVLTPNGDDINDDLCIPVTGADHWKIVVVDRWGVTRQEDEGCVTSNPVCMWSPSFYLPEDTYFYTVTFTNSCGANGHEVKNTQFIHIFSLGFKSTAADTTADEDNTDMQVLNRPSRMEGIEIFPNPVDDYLYIHTADKIEHVSVMDMNGKMVIGRLASNRINCSMLVAGAYYIEVKTNKGIERFKFIKL